jgi:RND family efflux transporter MFP subunit
MKIAKFFLPILILVIAVVFSAYMLVRSRSPAAAVPPKKLPIVEVMQVKYKDRKLHVTSQGTVNPKVQMTLSAEVTGKIMYASPAFILGDFFERDDLLLKIEPHEYVSQLASAKAQAAEARILLAQEELLAQQAGIDWTQLSDADPPALALRKPQLKKTRLAVEAADAEVATATRNLAKTQVKAPFSGLLKSKLVEQNEFVTRGTPLAKIISVDQAEIRLPVTSHEMALLGIPVVMHPDTMDHRMALKVTLSAMRAGEQVNWKAEIIRTEGVFDPRNRSIFLVAEVPDPYSMKKGRKQRLLPMGLFVQARIQSRHTIRSCELPISALHAENKVWIVDANNQLQQRTVNVQQNNTEFVWIDQGLEDGDWISLTPIDHATAGMTVLPKKVSENTAEFGKGA